MIPLTHSRWRALGRRYLYYRQLSGSISTCVSISIKRLRQLLVLSGLRWSLESSSSSIQVCTLRSWSSVDGKSDARQRRVHQGARTSETLCQHFLKFIEVDVCESLLYVALRDGRAVVLLTTLVRSLGDGGSTSTSSYNVHPTVQDQAPSRTRTQL